MGATTNEGRGIGSVEKFLPKIVNGVVKKENIQNGDVFENISSDILISTADGTAIKDDASSITIKAGDGYPLAVDPVGTYDGTGDDADGGDVNIHAGAANGKGEGGDIDIQAGNTGDGPDANAGNVYIQGGDADVAENSDAGDVIIRGGDASTGIGDSDGGDVSIWGGAAGDDGQAGWVYIYAGNSGNGDGSDENDPEAGSIEIYAGTSLATTDVNGGDITVQSGSGTVNGRGGDLMLYTGNGLGTDRAGDIFLSCGTSYGAGRNGQIYIESMPVMPVYADNAARDLAAGGGTNGMFCYNTTSEKMEVFVGGAWKTVTVS